MAALRPETQDTHHWILTFNRPHALNRLITNLGRQGIRSSVFSNHPSVQLTAESKTYLDEVVVNSLNSSMSNSWCARSWNSIMLRGWPKYDRLVLVQDDTNVAPNYGAWFQEQIKRFDIMWGPGGDQWHTLKFENFQRTGYWDERYIGCYCGDADYLKRLYGCNDQTKISIEDGHCWAPSSHNPTGIERYVLTEMHVKACDPNYKNQHWELEEGGNPTIKAADRHYRRKWGHEIEQGVEIGASYTRQPNMEEIDWYPWFTKLYDVNPNHGDPWKKD
jgi:hypothetical protein